MSIRWGSVPGLPSLPTVGTGRGELGPQPPDPDPPDPPDPDPPDPPDPDPPDPDPPAPDPPELVGTDVRATNSTSVTVTLPAGLRDGDLAALVWVGQPRVPTGTDPYPIEIAPPGWSFEDERVRSASMETYLYTRRLTAAESGQPVTFNVGSAQKSAVGLAVYRNVVDVRWSAAVYSNSDISHPAPQITTTVDSAIASIYCERGSAPSTEIVSAPAGLAGSQFNIGGGAGGVAVSASDAVASPGLVLPGDWTTDLPQAGVVVWTFAFSHTAPEPKPPVKVADMAYPVVAAHRFGAQEGPQNTLYQANMFLPTFPDTIGECDIRVNADSSLVLWHDPTVDSKAGGGETGNVEDFTDSQWDSLTVVWPWGSNPPEPASYWGEVLEIWGGRRVLMPELKVDEALQSFVESVPEDLVDSMIVQSSSYSRAYALADLGFHTLFLANSNETNFTAYAADGITHVGYNRDNITPELCSEAHAAGLKVWAYVVNNIELYDTLLAAGVDGMFSDKPTTLMNYQLSL